jgi:RNA polymerase sigma-70 factor (sigma-E family)
VARVSSSVSNSEFEDFARRELPRLLRYAVMLTGDSHLAQDLVQDVMVKVHAKWRSVAAAEHPHLYVKTMITRAFISWRRRWAVRNVLPAEELVGEPVGDHATSIAEHDDVWQRLATLPRQQRAVLVLRFYERLTDPEIADVLGCSPGTVRGYASRAIAALRLDMAVRGADQPVLTRETR